MAKYIILKKISSTEEQIDLDKDISYLNLLQCLCLSLHIVYL